MSFTLTIGGTAVDVPGTAVPERLTAYVKDGIPTFTFSVRGGALPGLPDPYVGKELIVTEGGVRVFVGDVMRFDPSPGGFGWTRQYTAFGLRHRGDWVPFTDDVTGLDTAGFNLPNVTDPGYIASRAGRTVGQILTTCLTMVDNAANLSQYGIGNYGGTHDAPTLPAATVADLAAMTIIPPAAVYVSGEKLLGAIEAFLSNWAPNTCLWIDPRDGTMRFIDLRTGFTPTTLTLGVDPVELPPLSRDLSHAAPRVLVRGQPMVMPVLASLTNGLLEEDFAHDGLDNTTAKAEWSPSDYNIAGTAQDSGTCTCLSTTTVQVTSSSTATTWVNDYWDQSGTGAHGWVHLFDPLLTNLLTAVWTTPIIACTAMTSGGTSILTVQNALPVTSYTSYTIFGYTGGASIVWRKYHITNSAIAAALASAFMADVPFVLAAGDGATLTSYPLGSVVWSSNGSAPYQEETCGFTQDPATGTIVFYSPTWTIAGGRAPHDVRALLAVNVRTNQVVKPDAGYEGTCHTEDGLTNTLTITVDQWRDPGQAANLEAYAQDVLDSVKDTVVEGVIVYRGLLADALLMGQAYQIAASYTTGWEGLTLPCLEMSLEWPQGTGSSYITSLHVSNRRAAYSAAAFLKPDRTGLHLGGEGFDLLNSVAFGYSSAIGSMGMSTLAGEFAGMQETIAQQGGAYAPQQIAAANDAAASQIAAANDPSLYLPTQGDWNALGASMDPSQMMPSGEAFAAMGLDDPNFQLPSGGGGGGRSGGANSIPPEAIDAAMQNTGGAPAGFADVADADQADFLDRHSE